MANNFFDKLNTLVKAHINDIVSPIDERTSKSRRKALARQEIRGGLENDVKALRKRIDDALDYETQLQSKVDKLYAEVADWDAKANKAVKDGRESDARTALTRMQQAQRELEMLEADLREHQFVTQELISQVSMLEGVVEQSKQESPDDSNDDVAEAENIGQQIVQQLDNTRQKLGELITNYTQQVTDDEDYSPERRSSSSDSAQAPSRPAHPVSRRDVDKEYDSRLARLSKPPSKDDKK